jgi:hypothetical protein
LKHPSTKVNEAVDFQERKMRPTSLIVNGNREMIIDAIDLQKGSGSKVNQAVALVLESVFNRSDLSASACGQFAEADGTSWDVVGSAPV